jgi:hypothetical protein
MAIIKSSFIVIDPKVLLIIIQITIRATIFKNSNQSFFKGVHSFKSLL